MGEADRVQVVGPNGERGSVDANDLPAVLAQKGRVLTPDEAKEEEHGGIAGALGAAALGAGETLTSGGSTAAMGELAVALGGQQGRRDVEDKIRGLETTNPISHGLGEVAPLLLAPEAGGEEAIASVLGKAESPLAKAAQWAAPEFARGAIETAHLDGSQGVNEASLDHDLAAESYYSHALNPEVLYGGLLNVGVAGAFKGLGKLTPSLGRSMAGRLGEVAANDSALAEDLTRSFQKAGGTSDDASAVMRELGGMAERRAASPDEMRGPLDKSVQAYIEAQAGGNADKARQMTKMYKGGAHVDVAIEKEISGIAQQADPHIATIANDLTTMEREQFGLKHQQVLRNADPDRIPFAADAANQWLKELEATISLPDLPPTPNPREFHRAVSREMKGAAPDVIAAEAASRHGIAMADHAKQVSDLIAQRESLVDPEVRRLFGDPATRVGFANKDINMMQSLIDKSRREVAAGVKEGGAEGHARIFTALDDTKRIVGRMGKFGDRIPGATQQFEQYMYQNRLRPMLEDSNIWGSRLSDLQTQTNAAWSDTMQAVGAFRKQFTTSLSSTEGVKNLRPNGSTRSFIESLGAEATPSVAEETVSRTLDAVKARGAAMLKNMDLTPQAVAAIERSGKSANALEKILAEGKQVASDARSIKAMRASETHFAAHGIVGTMLSMATSPAKTLATLGQINKAITSVRGLFSKESKGFIEGNAVPVVKATLSEAERKAAVASIADVKRYAADPRAAAVAIRDILGDMPNTTPKVSSSLATTIARGIMALAKRAPEPLPAKFADKPGEDRYANGDLERYWRDKSLVESPPKVLTLMRTGQIHQQDMDLMKEVIPRLVTQMQMQLDSDLQDAKAKGALRRMSYQEQISLSWMLGRPLDATQGPDFIAAMQQTAADDPMNQAAIGKSAMGGGRPSKLANINLERFESTQERLEQ